MSAPGLQFIVLTGFLGSGKTTLLRHFLKASVAADTAVIVNEAGEVGLDGVILREGGGDTPMTMLANGCICCQAGNDLSATIDTLLMMGRSDGCGPLRRIVLETSGLSKPGPILRQLATLAERRLRIAVVATFDAVRGTQVTEFDEAAAQWAAAHRIVVTKTDVVSAERLQEVAAVAAALNPVADVVATANRESAVDAAFAPLPRFAPLIELPRAMRTSSHPRISVCVARPTCVLTCGDLGAWLDDLAGALGDRLLRLKGLVHVADCERPLLVQSVGTLFSSPRPFELRGQPVESFLVIMVRDLGASQMSLLESIGRFAISGPHANGSTSSIAGT